MKRNPRQGYDPTAVPASSESHSRFSVDRTPGGISVASTAEAVAAAYEQLLAERIADTPEAQPERKTVELQVVVKTGEDYEVVDRGSVTAVPTRAVSRSGRFKRQKAEAGALIDLCFLGEDVRDSDAWNALLELCRQERPDSATCRLLSDRLAVLILLRAGIVAARDDLPTEHLNERRAA